MRKITLENIVDERDAVNKLIKHLEETIKENSHHPVESFAISLDDERDKIKTDKKEFEVNCKTFNYNPNQNEINTQIGRFLILKAIDKVKLMLPEIYIHCRNKQFASDYAKDII
jgi:hypothetical protein